MNRKQRPTTGRAAEQDDDLYEYIGDKIRAHREAVGWKQGQLAEEMGVTPNTISRWESATYKPKAGDIDRLARLFEVDVWAFFPSSAEAPTTAQSALLSATGDLPKEDLEELERYAQFIRTRKVLESGGAKRRRRKPAD